MERDRRAEPMRTKRAAAAFGLALLFSALLAWMPGGAAAQIDVSGRWHFQLIDTLFEQTTDRVMTLTQSGSAVTVAAPAPYTGGVIDPLTGVLHLDGGGGCVDYSTFQFFPVPWSIDATVAADGLSMTGSFAESIQPTRSCFLLDGSLQGDRLPESCGDAVVDAGEACDAGAAGSACCTAYCTPVAAGAYCAAATACGTSACDGAGACVATPKSVNTLCRFASGPCDTPELCDGTSTECPPPSSPTQPDGDGDGVLDPCDDCVGQPLEQPMIRLGRFAGTAGAHDFINLSARVRLAPGATLPDPWGTWKLVEVHGQNPGSGFYVQVPGGAWDPALGYGWTRRGSRWLFRSTAPASGAVSRMTIAPVANDPGAYLVRITTPRAALAMLAPQPPLSMELIIDGLGPSTKCGQATFSAPGGAAPACKALSRGGVLSCR